MHPDGPIIDSYAKPGALDLQLRFTGYNWYTLMYRESYDMVADTFKSLRLNDGKLPNLYIPDHPFHAAVDTIGSTLRYVVKSGIKAGLYMTPAVPTFWITRTPQTKFKGIVVNADSVNNVGERSFISELPESVKKRNAPLKKQKKSRTSTQHQARMLSLSNWLKKGFRLKCQIKRCLKSNGSIAICTKNLHKIPRFQAVQVFTKCVAYTFIYKKFPILRLY